VLLWDGPETLRRLGGELERQGTLGMGQGKKKSCEGRVATTVISGLEGDLKAA